MTQDIQKITVIGGGPGGLYFALLTKKRLPNCQIDVYEQNRSNDTFGFGVVFSDETLDEFLNADPESYHAIKSSFAYWTDIKISHEQKKTIIGGNGFAGCSRKTLLQLLQARCSEVGVGLHFSTKIDYDNLDQQFSDSDIIVGSDGINSGIRRNDELEFGTKIVETRNKFTWLGSTKPLDAFTFFFQQTEHGHFCAHSYQYEEGRSTWVVETTPECWEASGFADMDESQSAKYLETVFKDDLDGHPFLTNRSIWRNFPTVKCKKWHTGNRVLLGDSKATAHWSIGSGTKLAMECAIALSNAILNNTKNVDVAFSEYDQNRRTQVEITQHNAQVSLQWFENMPSHWSKDQYEFAFSLMSRAKSVTWDNLGMRDAGFIDRVKREFCDHYSTQSGVKISSEETTPMFTPFQLRDMCIDNRVAVAPLALYSANDGLINALHHVHYGARAHGGAGLIFTEMTFPSPEARATPQCAGIWNDEHETEWKKLVDFIHTTSSKIALQLNHAGSKASTNPPDKALNTPLKEGTWPIYAASPIPFLDGISQIPIQIDREKMDDVKASFINATQRAARTGFDMIELQCGHGSLLGSFISPLTNKRNDKFGGDALARVSYPVEVFKAMRAVWPKERPISVRISASDWAEDGLSLHDLIVISKAFKEAGVDIINVSSGETVSWEKPIYGRMWQTPFSEYIKQHVDIPTITAGEITLPEQINTIIAADRADLCALGRPYLNDPSFVRKAAAHYGVKKISGSPLEWPKQLSAGEPQLYREAEKLNTKTRELAHKARPNRRHYKSANEPLI